MIASISLYMVKTNLHSFKYKLSTQIIVNFVCVLTSTQYLNKFLKVGSAETDLFSGISDS